MKPPTPFFFVATAALILQGLLVFTTPETVPWQAVRGALIVGAIGLLAVDISKRSTPGQTARNLVAYALAVGGVVLLVLALVIFA